MRLGFHRRAFNMKDTKALVRRARAHSPLSEEQALTLAQDEVRATRHAS